ncbi:MAG: phenylalanine--tRNA ligase subunit beta [Alphaproteobacteria bacterium]|nr:phenylalanine--tRNA ligase subunit beta [Alphaproteobacteria bacterium]
MKIHADVLGQYTALPESLDDLRHLLDDVGIEVKRGDGQGGFTLELLANRGDHHCYEGVARELSGRTGAPVLLPPVAALEVGEAGWPLRLETDLCLVYTATVLERVADHGALPADALAPLTAAGIHSLTAPVDATNLSNLELGQPTHVFDAEKIEGPITIRLSRAGETCWPLFQEGHVPVPEGTLVIADDVKILAVAGVIGCEDSKTTAETRRIVLESATFDPVSVRLAGRAMDVHTDSRARFERGSDPARPLVGAGRVVHLLEAHAGWQRVGPTACVGAWTDPRRTIQLSARATAAFLEHPLTPSEIAERLRRYGFTVTPAGDALAVVVPPHRLWDVEHPADLYEELAKSIGYNHTAISLPPVDMGARPSDRSLRKARAEEILLAQGFHEVFTDGFYGRDVLDRMGITEGHPLYAHVETANALDRAYSLLKNNALAQAVEAVAINLRMRNEQIKAYEWTRTFHPQAQAPADAKGRLGSPAAERPLLWLIASGTDRPPAWEDRSRPADPLFLKGVLEELACELGLGFTLGPADPGAPLYSLLHPNRQAQVLLDGRAVGTLGEVHPDVLQAHKIKRARPVYLELDAEAVLSEGTRPAFEEPPVLHPIARSLAFSLPGRVQAGDVAATMRAAAPDWLRSLDITDLFIPEDEAVRAVTFSLSFHNAPDAERSADEVNHVLGVLVDAVARRFGEAGVVQR